MEEADYLTLGKLYQIVIDEFDGEESVVCDDGDICILDNYLRFHARPDADGWIKWDGGKCPVKEGQQVTVKYRNGKVKTGPALDPSLDLEQGFWDNDQNPWDIIAYRPVAPDGGKD